MSEEPASSTPFDDLIAQPQPRSLNALHMAKVALVLLAVLAFVVGVVTSVLGFTLRGWIEVAASLLAASVIVAFLANRWSESLFARRAMTLGLDERQAREFYRTYDWDETD